MSVESFGCVGRHITLSVLNCRSSRLFLGVGCDKQHCDRHPCRGTLEGQLTLPRLFLCLSVCLQPPVRLSSASSASGALAWLLAPCAQPATAELHCVSGACTRLRNRGGGPTRKEPTFPVRTLTGPHCFSVSPSS